MSSKISKILVVFLSVSFVAAVPASVPASAQIGQFLKGATKSIFKKGAKKEALKEGAEQAAKQAAKKGAKEGAEDFLRVGTKKAALRKVKRDAAGRTFYRGSKVASQAELKSFIQIEARSVAKKTLLKRSGSAFSRNAFGKASAERMLRNSAGRNLFALEKSAFKASAKLNTAVARRTAGQLSKKLGKEGYNYWRKLVPDIASDANRVLLEDLGSNRSFQHLIAGRLGKKAAPQCLDAYMNMIAAPSLRTDVSMLRYLSKGAAGGADMFFHKGIYKKTAYGLAKDLRMIEEKGVVKVYKEGVSKPIGTITGDAVKGFNIDVPYEDRTLLNLFPKGNATYTTTRRLGHSGYTKLTWEMDKYGKLKRSIVETKPDGRFIPVARDKNAIQSAGKIKKDYNVFGQPVSGRPTYIMDDCGHASALQIGGTNDYINLFSQNASMNKGAWKAGEDIGRKAIQEGKTVVRETRYLYANKFDMRPKSMTVNQTADGVSQISSQVFENLIQAVK